MSSDIHYRMKDPFIGKWTNFVTRNKKIRCDYCGIIQRLVKNVRIEAAEGKIEKNISIDNIPSKFTQPILWLCTNWERNREEHVDLENSGTRLMLGNT